MAIERNQTKTDGRVKDTRQRILREARALYYRGGYAGISLDEVAKKVGTSKAALFHHFKSKQELFFTVLMEICDEHQRVLEQAIAEGVDTRSRLRNILRALTLCPFFDPMKFHAEEREQLSAEQQQQAQQAFSRAIRQPLASVLTEGITIGELRAHNPALSLLVFMNLTMLLPSPGNPLIRQNQSPDTLQYIDELLDLFFQGVGQAGG